MPKDEVIIYQLEKVDQAGEVSDLFEARILQVAADLDLLVRDNEIELPGGRYAGLTIQAYIRQAG